MRAAFLASLFLAAYACGADKSASSDAPAGDQPGDNPSPGTAVGEVPYSLAVPNDAALPPCDEASKYRLVFVQDQAVFKSCSGTAWSVIDVKGKDGTAGKDGADGKDGEAGENGADGASFGITAQWTCNGQTADLDTADADISRFGFGVEVVKFSNGDFFISCLDRISDSDFTYADSTSSSGLFTAQSNAVAAGAISCLPFYVQATFDIDDEEVTWEALATNETDTVSCTKTFP